MPMPVRLKLRFALVAFTFAAAAFAACSSTGTPSSGDVVAGGKPAPGPMIPPSALVAQSYERVLMDSGGPVCEHLEDPWSIRICPEMMAAKYFKPAEVVAETLEVRLRNNRVIRVGINPRADAIFLTPSALNVFLLRHYDATNPAAAAELREFIRKNYK